MNKTIKNYTLCTINVISINYVDNQKLVWEMEVLSNNDLYLCLSTNNSYSVRDALDNPDFNMKTNIFDKPVGINKENIIVYELRTHY